jgi:hypothetical protein
MDMPHLRPINPPRQSMKRLFLWGIAIFMVLAFLFAAMINIPEWR